MRTHVIILAQGTQQRMVTEFPKQLLPLASCANEPILGRTIRQLGKIFGRPDLALAEHHRGQTLVTLVTWSAIGQSLFPDRQEHTLIRFTGSTAEMEVVALPDPGNSSLKGIYRYLESQAMIAGGDRYDRTIVLLGDVVYSWACLEALFAPLSRFPGRDAIDLGAASVAARFVGTSDIGPAGGELWGVAWMRPDEDVVIGALEKALEKHPPYVDTYQPGQLRRWMWAIHPSYQTTSRYVAIDDYTMDVDLPEHVSRLVPASAIASRDDRHHDLFWYGR